MTTKRRGQGDGSVFYDEGRSRWVALLDLGIGPNGKRQRRKLTGRTRSEVTTKLRAAQRAAEDGLPIGSANDTVGLLLDDFLTRGLPATCKADKTREGYEWAVSHIRPVLGHKKLRELTVDDVDDLLHGKAETNMSRASLVQIHAVLKRALRWGQRRGRVARNVAELTGTPAGKKRVSKALTPEQARALLAAAKDHRLEALIMIALTVPSRPGELTGLSWSNVDLENGVIHFRQALHRSSKSELTVGALKTEQSRRSVEVPTFVVGALRRRRKVQVADQLKAGAAWINSDDLIFTTEIGSPIDPANLRRTLRQLMAKAQIPGTWTVYELRHSAVSILSHSGVSIELIADAAGHRNSRVTSTVYRHNLALSSRAPRVRWSRYSGPLWGRIRPRWLPKWLPTN